MENYIIPSVGLSGYFELSDPMSSHIADYEKYTCQAVRRISDYLANNEDPKTNIYDKYNISESIYEDHVKKNIPIVSLQSDVGHWLYVPVNYITKYPITNGVPYRSYMIGVSLPALPVKRDISHVQTAINNLVKDMLGVDCKIKLVETSRTILVPDSEHTVKQSARDAISQGAVTDRSRYMKTAQQLQAALDKITELESYIQNNL